MRIYRAVPRIGFDPAKAHGGRADTRLPGNLPYLIDNLWEYTRPTNMPSRRTAVFASPSATLALQGAIAGDRTADQYYACEVNFGTPPARLMQLSVRDARYHADLPRIQKIVNQAAGSWFGRDAASKALLAPLFLPGTTKLELASAIEGNDELRVLVETAAASVRMWSDLPDVEEGEIVFELEPDNWFTLQVAT